MGPLATGITFCLAIWFSISVGMAPAAEREPLAPRVPAHERAEARTWKAPFGSTKRVSDKILAEGKKLYEGQGTCLNCHGESGRGDGPAGRVLNPSPTNFTNCKFHKRSKKPTDNNIKAPARPKP